MAAGCALAILGCQLDQTWPTVSGLVVATAKPHLSGPLIFFILLFEPKQRRSIAIMVGIVGMVVAYAAAVNSSLLHSYVDAIHTYNTGPVNDPAGLFGAISLFLHFGIPLPIAQILGMLSLLVVPTLAAWLLRCSHGSLTRIPVALMLVPFSTGLARGIQGYDLCCYAMGIALVAVLDFRYRWIFLVPALLVWCPGVLGRVWSIASGLQVGSFAWLGLLIATVAIAATRLRAYRINRSWSPVAEPTSG